MKRFDFKISNIDTHFYKIFPFSGDIFLTLKLRSGNNFNNVLPSFTSLDRGRGYNKEGYRFNFFQITFFKYLLLNTY